MPRRRTILIGLGGVMVGGGALFGTGAFSTVEAERTVTVETADDAAGFLGLQIRDDLAAEGETIGLDFGERGLNRNFESEFFRALLIRNQGTQDGIGVAFEYEIAGETDGAAEIFQFVPNPEEGTFDDGAGGIEVEGEPPLDAGEAAAYDLVVDLRYDRLSDDAQAILDSIDIDSFDVTVTVRAGPDVGDDPDDETEQVGIDIEIDGDRGSTSVGAGETIEYRVFRLFDDGSEVRILDPDAISMDVADSGVVSFDADAFELIAENSGETTLTVTEPETGFETTFDLTVTPELPQNAVAFRDVNDNGVYEDGEDTYTAADLRDLDVEDPVVIARDVTNSTWPAFEIEAEKLTIQDGVSVVSEGGEIEIEAETGDLVLEPDADVIARNGGAEIELDSAGDVVLADAEVRSVAEMDIDSEGDILASDATIETSGGGADISLTADGVIELEDAVVNSVAPITIDSDEKIRADGVELTTTDGGSDITVRTDGSISIDDASISSGAVADFEAEGFLYGPDAIIEAAEISIDIEGEITFEGASIVSDRTVDIGSEGPLDGLGASVSGTEIDLEIEESITLTGASIESERDLDIQSGGSADVESAILSAANGWVTITVDLGENAQFLVVDAEFTAGGQPTDVQYSPESVTIVGAPAVGGTTL